MYRVGIFSTSVGGFPRLAVSFNIHGASKDFCHTNLDFGRTTMEVFVVPASFYVFSHMRVTPVGKESKHKCQAIATKTSRNFRKHLSPGRRNCVRNKYHLTDVGALLVIAVSDISPGAEVTACTGKR